MPDRPGPPVPVDELANAPVPLGKLASRDPVTLSGPELREALLETWRQTCRLQARLTRLVAEFDTRQAGNDDAAHSTAAWLRAFTRMSGPQAAALVRAAEATRSLPAVAAAFDRGEVSAAHVDRVADLARRVGVERVAEVEQILVEAARECDPQELGVVCGRVRAHVDPDGVAPDARRDFARREVTFAKLDGMVVVRGQLDAEGGATVLSALDALMKPPVSGDDRTSGQRRADALVDLARNALHAGQLPSVGGGRPHLGVLVDLNLLRSATDVSSTTRSGAAPLTRLGPSTPPTLPSITDLPAPAWTTWAGPIDGSTVRRLACDSVVYRVVLDPTNGLPTDLGRTVRTVPGWLRRALVARDRGCRFPGCRALAAWCDGHHLKSWLDGGGTEVGNLILLCRYHHVLIHQCGWSVQFDPATGEVSATRPDGRAYEVERSRAFVAAWSHPEREVPTQPDRDVGDAGAA